MVDGNSDDNNTLLMHMRLTLPNHSPVQQSSCPCPCSCSCSKIAVLHKFTLAPWGDRLDFATKRRHSHPIESSLFLSPSEKGSRRLLIKKLDLLIPWQVICRIRCGHIPAFLL